MSECHRISAEELRAFGSHAYTPTYHLAMGFKGENGSAVAVQLGNRLLLATARHVVEDRNLMLTLRDPPTTITEFAGCHVHPHVDVGILEIRPEDVGSLKSNYLDSTRLALASAPEIEHEVLVVGYPGALSGVIGRQQITHQSELQIREARSLSFHSSSIPISDWPTITSLNYRPSRESDIYIHFDPEESMTVVNMRQPLDRVGVTHGTAPRPYGMSGCGIWIRADSDASGVWQPQARLHGIQVGYHKDGGWLHGILISRWLELVETHYPELRDEIAGVRLASSHQRIARTLADTTMS